MSTAVPRSFSDRRWHVARGERAALAAGAGTYFLLLCGYYMLRSLREAMALEAGSRYIPLLFMLTLAVMLVILPAYWWVVARVPRDRLLAAVYLPVVSLFIVVALFIGNTRVPPLLAVGYFILVTAVNLFLVSVFWSVMADVWRPENAKRLFGMVAAGGSAGALVGPFFNAAFVQSLGVRTVMGIACSLIAGAVITGVAAQRLRARAPDVDVNTRVAVGGRAVDDLKRLAHSPYLLAIAGFIVIGQVFGAFMYNEQARYIEATYPDLAARAAVFARLDLASSVLSLLMQALVVGWLTVRGGVGATLTAMWALAALSFGALVLLPTGAMLLTTQVIRRGADYGLFKPAREMLFTVLSPETKFKSKSLLDTVLYRGADSVGNGLYLLVAPLGLAGIAAVCTSACVLLVMGARWLGAAFADQESKGLRSC
jgi:ATP:ADP antiporter, AAA family